MGFALWRDIYTSYNEALAYRKDHMSTGLGAIIVNLGLWMFAVWFLLWMAEKFNTKK